MNGWHNGSSQPPSLSAIQQWWVRSVVLVTAVVLAQVASIEQSCWVEGWIFKMAKCSTLFVSLSVTWARAASQASMHTACTHHTWGYSSMLSLLFNLCSLVWHTWLIWKSHDRGLSAHKGLMGRRAFLTSTMVRTTSWLILCSIPI